MSWLIAALKERLQANKGNYVQVQEWCGDTENGFYDDVTFDMDALLKEIDDFGAEVRDRAKRLEIK